MKLNEKSNLKDHCRSEHGAPKLNCKMCNGSSSEPACTNTWGKSTGLRYPEYLTLSIKLDYCGSCNIVQMSPIILVVTSPKCKNALVLFSVLEFSATLGQFGNTSAWNQVPTFVYFLQRILEPLFDLVWKFEFEPWWYGNGFPEYIAPPGVDIWHSLTLPICIKMLA